jgi:plastocyanin
MSARYLAALAVVVLVLSFAGCSRQELVTGQASYEGQQVDLGATAEDAAVKEYEVLLRERDGEDVSFFPQTFAASAGDTVRLVFLFQEPHFISIEGAGVAERVQAGAIEFVAPERGEYDVRCWDCEDDPLAVVIVS